jgi:glycosyltransferase involved in cell wall biosynthesis
LKIAAFLSHPIQHFSPLWQELARRPGVELKVFYYSRQGIEKGLDHEFGVELAWDVDLLSGYEHEFLPRQWLTRDPLDSSWNGLNRGLTRALSDGPDVAYVAGYAHLNNWAVAHLCRRFKIPLLYQSDSNILAERKRSAWRRWLKRRIIRPFFRRVTVFLACGDHNRDYLLCYGAPTDCIWFSAIPVDTQRFRWTAAGLDATARGELRRQYGLEPKDLVAGFSGKLIDHKRPFDLLRAVASLGRDDVKALFIGAGPLEHQLRRQAGSARYAGFVNQTTLPKVLSLCDALVVPSGRDAHPLTVTEAQCLGIPVILSDQCGCYGPNDVFRDGESGILYPCGDVPRLSKAIAYLMDNPSERARLGRRAVELAETQSVKATGSNFLAAAKSAIGLSKSNRGESSNRGVRGLPRRSDSCAITHRID